MIAKNAPEQLDLIDCEPENAKNIKALIRKRNAHNQTHLGEKKKADECDLKIMEAVVAAGGKPDVNGVTRIKVGDSILEIKPGKAKLHIEEKDADDDDDAGEPDEETQTDGAEQQSRRRRVSNA
jgi:hypothetical protein